MSDFEKAYQRITGGKVDTRLQAYCEDIWNAAIASMQGEAVKPEWFSITDGDNWFECPDDSAILDCVHPVSVGTEYEVLAAYPSIRQTYRITKVPDDVSDDTEVELITSNGNLLYTHAPDSAARIAEYAAEIARLTKELEEARKDAERYRWWIKNRNNLIEVWEQKRGYRSTAIDACREVWNEFIGWRLDNSDNETIYQTEDEAIDAAISKIGGGE